MITLSIQARELGPTITLNALPAKQYAEDLEKHTLSALLHIKPTSPLMYAFFRINTFIHLISLTLIRAFHYLYSGTIGR